MLQRIDAKDTFLEPFGFLLVQQTRNAGLENEILTPTKWQGTRRTSECQNTSCQVLFRSNESNLSFTNVSERRTGRTNEHNYSNLGLMYE